MSGPDGTLAEALAALEARLTATPAICSLLRPWIEHHRVRLTHAGFVPVFAAPRWVQLVQCRAVDEQLDFDLTYSTLCGYLFVRLVDDIMDGQYDDAHRLTPALAVFDAEFHRVYREHFAAGHPFWEEFEASWTGSVESATEDASASIDNRETFARIAARKLTAIRIPVAAACHLVDRPDSLGEWMHVCDTICSLHQFADDLSDWQDDLSAGRRSWLINKARQHAGNAAAAWILEEGHGWALRMLDELTRLVIVAANEAESPEVAAHATTFNSAIQQRWRQMQPAAHQLAMLARAMDSA